MTKYIILLVCFFLYISNCCAQQVTAQEQLKALIIQQERLLDMNLNSLESELINGNKDQISLFIVIERLPKFKLNQVIIRINGKEVSHQYSQLEQFGLLQGAMHPFSHTQTPQGKVQLSATIIGVDHLNNLVEQHISSSFIKKDKEAQYVLKIYTTPKLARPLLQIYKL